MEYVFGLIFTLLKVAVQASVYATLFLVLISVWARFSPDSGLAKFTSNGKRVWWQSGLAASLALCLIANTPWGNHGLGDYARIPLGHGLAIEELNGTTAYFEPVSMTEQSDVITEVVSYQVSNDILCAKMNDGRYFTYDLAARHYQPFADSTAYNSTAQKLGLPVETQFESFAKHYNRYWENWRFWLLA
ncbi:hypothetical protein JAO73_06530 [Hymenobacter sp. BT523]|uniref:hypothetical protein n=1 Tax=Hymenobacter sp. BT523 TaxID=2795725 RepID=UPI0018EAA578|nr:hypothetical protein [Hymenobacter sp. BT523]MBJ6108655.1 hypothetical protein [Hymenobacter sp. BT523]